MSTPNPDQSREQPLEMMDPFRTLSRDGADLLRRVSEQPRQYGNDVIDWMQSENPAIAAEGFLISGYLQYERNPAEGLLSFEESRRRYVGLEDYGRAAQVVHLMEIVCGRYLGNQERAATYQTLRQVYEGRT